jgi:hypothetical protein
MKLVAIKTFSYAGKRIAVGDIFETKTSRDGHLLVGIRNARELENRPEAKVPEPKTNLVERAHKRVETPKEEVKPVIEDKTDSESKPETEDKEPEVTPDEAPEVTPDEAPEVKPEAEDKEPEVTPAVTTELNTNKRTYSRKK